MASTRLEYSGPCAGADWADTVFFKGFAALAPVVAAKVAIKKIAKLKR
jgi:hypothetical protein